MKKNKKFGFVTPILIVLLLVVIFSYFVEGRSGVSHIALGDLLFNYLQSFYYFFDTILFVFVVGGLYGALNKVPAYKKLLNKIASKVEAKKKLFVILTTIFFVLLTALGGFDLLAFLFIPFVVSIILLLGYDKFVALSSTVVATFVGVIGGIFLAFRDGTNQYATSFTTFDKVTGLSGLWDNIIPKLLLLVLGTALLIFFILRYIKNDKDHVEIGSRDVFYVEERDGSKKEEKTLHTWPIVVLGVILFVFLLIGFMPWNSLFGFDCFDKFHTWLTGLSIGNYVVFTSLISKNITALGRWGDMGGYMMSIMCMLIFLILVKWIYRVQLSEMSKGFIYGVKKMIPVVMVLVLAYSVLVSSYNNGFMETLITNSADGIGDNVLMASLLTMFGTVVSVDRFYIVAGVISPIVSSLTDKADLNVYATLFQSFYGLLQMCGPTSLLLIISLSYLEVPYSKWLKYIWRFILYMLILIFIVLIITSLI